MKVYFNGLPRIALWLIRNDNKADCHEKSSDFSRNDDKSVDCHDFLRSLAMTVIKEFLLEFRSLNLK